MKYMVISDIHGSSYYLKLALDKFKNSSYDKLICLGDFFYHGPRNPLPKDYNPKLCSELLNSIGDKLIKIKGNCDADIDEELLGRGFYDDFKLVIGNCSYLFTHGHKINEESKPNIDADFVVLGHFHIQKDIIRNNIHFISPGSISLPKNDSFRGYMVIDDGGYKIFNLEK